MLRRHFVTYPLILYFAALLSPDARAAFHLWHVKEVFSNADGSVQFIELFDSFAGERLIAGHSVIANSDGVIKTFSIPANLPTTPSTANTHFLLATPGFNLLPGGVTPNFTLPDPAVNGPFFNPNATNITITFNGSNDSMSFSGSLLPKDGFQSLTDTNASGFPPGTPNIVVTDNTPTRFPNTAGQIDLRAPAPTGDYNGNGEVDAADYVLWRKTLNQPASPAGSGADGDADGTIDAGDYDFWAARFGNSVPGAGAGAVNAAVPEPATAALLGIGCLFWQLRLLRLRPRCNPPLRGIFGG
jgi:hypothetical protein